MSERNYRTVRFRHFGAFVVEWDPANHDGEHEPWDSIEATLNDGWAAQLAANGLQETADPPITERETDPRTDRRRVVRRAWVLPVDVPPEVARRCKETVLHGVVTFDPDGLPA